MRRPTPTAGEGVRFLALVMVVGLALGACAGGGAGGGGDDPLGLGPAPAGELRIAAGEDIWPLTGSGPSAKHFAAGELDVGVFEPLVSLAPDHTVRPGLAVSWEQLDDGAWRFHLRRGVTFHDGRTFTADDVVWSWTERQFYPGSVASELEPDSVVRVDDFTVDFRTTTVDNRLPEKLVHPEGPILPRGGHNDSDPVVGTGPYRVVEYVPRQRVVVERYPGYWGAAASVERMTFVFMADAGARARALRDGEVQVAANLSPAAGAELAADPAFSVVVAPPGAVQTLTFNLGGATGSMLVDDPAIRRAVALALDRSAYVDAVLGGAAQPGRWLSPPSVLGPSAELVATPVFDRAEASGVLDAAGWLAGADGVRQRGAARLTLTIVAGPAVPASGLDEIRTQLATIGVEVAAKRAADTVTAAQFRAAGFDAELGMPNQNDANPAFLVGLRAAGNAGTGRPALVAAAEAAAVAPDRASAQQAAARAMQILLNDEILAVPLATVSRRYGMVAGLRIGEPHPSAINQRWATVIDGR